MNLVKIDRVAVDESLLEFALQGHGVILGAPGVGKSYALRALAKTLKKQSLAFLLVEVETLADATESDFKAAMGYSTDFRSAMEELFAARPTGGVIIFDGYDAARAAAARERLADRISQLIHWCPPAWKVVVSVRTYDAQKSPRLLSLFGRARESLPQRFVRPSLQIRHFLVPELDDVELESALSQIPAAAAFVDLGSEAVRNLLRRPFNLWLLEQVVASAEAAALPVQVQSEVQLLAMYWRAYVSNAPDEVARGAVLAAITDRMVTTRHLQVAAADVFAPALERAWNGLLSDEVITSPTRFAASGLAPQAIAFRHNILFDYAVAVLLVEKSAEAVRRFLRDDPYRPLFLRPSLTYLFTGLWVGDREAFWEVFLGLLPATEVPVRLVARVIPPNTVATFARTMDDLRPLMDLSSDVGADTGAAIARVLAAAQDAGYPQASLWAEFASVVSPDLKPSFGWNLGQLVSDLSQDGELTIGDRNHVGEAARTVLKICLDRREPGFDSWYDALGAAMALPAVLATVDTQPGATEVLLSPILGMVGAPAFPIQYFYRLCDGVGKLLKYLPEFVTRLYTTAFAHEEDSQEVTRFGSLRVIPMTSTRRQDYEMCWYVLATAYGEFLEVAPDQAIRACVSALDAVATSARAPAGLETTIDMSLAVPFEFRGRVRSFVEVSPWFTLRFRRSDLERMVDLLAETPIPLEDGLTAEQVVDAFAEYSTTSRSWALLLDRGSGEPKSYANLLFELAIARPVVFADDIESELAAFISACYPEWTVEQRRRFERFVTTSLSGDGEPTLSPPEARRLRWLLTRPDRGLLVTPEAAAIVAELTTVERDRQAHRRPSISVSSREVTTSSWLGERGIAVTEPTNATLIEARDRWASRADALRNTAPTEQEVPELSLVLADGIEALRAGEGAAEAVIESAWTAICQIAVAVSKTQPPLGSALLDNVRQVLSTCSRFPEPAADADRDQQYTWASWGPSPRTEAIQGWSYLLGARMDVVASGFLFKFAKSAEPSERTLVILHATQYFRTDPESFWGIITEVARGERNVVVASSILQILSHLGTSSDAARRPIVKAMVPAFAASDTRDIAQARSRWLAYFAFVCAESWAYDEIQRIVDADPPRENGLVELVSSAMWYVEPSEPADDHARQVVARSVGWLVGLSATLDKRVADERRRLANAAGESRGANGQADVYVKVVDRVVRSLWLRLNRRTEDSDNEMDTTGASGDSDGSGERGTRIYLATVKPILEALLSNAEKEDGIGIVAPTAYRFLEIAKAILAFNVVEAIAMASRVASASRMHGFHLDSLAATEAVAIVEIALADHKREVAASPTLDHMLSLLDAFADAGWPAATRLVWRLEDVYR